MLIKISFDANHVVDQGNGFIVLEAKFYSEYSLPAYLVTVGGSTKEDFKNNKIKSAKYLVVGQNGGMSVEKG